ncbi:MAG: hypothetical protein KA109_15635 [Saprospiraceae bacterium]|jgi:hypothetical protein|nr:hypothetical protein [Saprospiraceae bacterium]MBK6479885.1 hypothetical protein [Saprospiraceae bacterium]MBK6815258.1 hypothetical protein [Saprospiraceae bacterium]MBK7372295.1 hypothetical protein [Saprospiraceae bacterium]MBK7435239.1 hypothetical protein [Saprospiraceae bacterium]
MKDFEADNSIVKGYAELLDSLSSSMKLDLIAKLSDSIKSDLKSEKSLFQKSFGAFESKKSAEEIITEIRSSRMTNRLVDQF